MGKEEIAHYEQCFQKLFLADAEYLWSKELQTTISNLTKMVENSLKG